MTRAQPQPSATDLIGDVVRRISTARAAALEVAVRSAILSYLPRPLHGAADHPRLLGLIYRVRPSWRPTIQVYADPAAPCHAAVQRRDGSVIVVP